MRSLVLLLVVCVAIAARIEGAAIKPDVDDRCTEMATAEEASSPTPIASDEDQDATETPVLPPEDAFCFCPNGVCCSGACYPGARCCHNGVGVECCQGSHCLSGVCCANHTCCLDPD